MDFYRTLDQPQLGYDVVRFSRFFGALLHGLGEGAIAWHQTRVRYQHVIRLENDELHGLSFPHPQGEFASPFIIR